MLELQTNRSSSLLFRIRAFRRRNKGNVLNAAVRLAVARAVRRREVRRALAPILAPRQPETWAFMTGCYNSGTTILRRILSVHPEIGTLAQEGVHICDAFPVLEKDGWRRMWHRNAALAEAWSPDPAALSNRAARDWSLLWDRKARIFMEKSIHHTAWMNQLESAFPGARFIFVVRNGLCSAEGIMRRAAPDGEAKQLLGQDTYPPEEAAKQWVVSNAPLLKGGTLPKQMLVVRYEEFIAAPEAVMRRILEFLGADTSVLKGVDANNILMAGVPFEIRDQNPGSLGRLDAETRKRMLAVMGEELEQLGYDVPAN